MGKFYTIDEKVEILKVLDANNGAMLLTAKELGMPRRTLQNWADFRDGVLDVFLEGEALENYKGWSPFWEDRQNYVRPPKSMYPKTLEQANAELAGDDEITEELMGVRERLMKGIVRLSKAIEIGDGDDSLVSEQAMAISRLIDRVDTLDERIIAWRMLNKPNVLRVEYTHPDGMVYDRPIEALGDGGDTDEEERYDPNDGYAEDPVKHLGG